MAPKYAPSLRSRLPPLLLFLQTTFILLYYFSTELDRNVDGLVFNNFYPVFQDLNVMIFMGFGFLGSFLVRYGFSASGFNFLIAVIATQWALLLNGMESWYYSGKIRIGLRSLAVAEMCTASVLISIGAVQGKTNHVQLILMALLEVFGLVLNEWLLQTLLSTRPTHGIMVLHIFGTFFGLVLTWILCRQESDQGFEKEKLDHKSGLFSMLGTVFLWIFWPSFNSILADDHFPEQKLRAVCSTYLALAVSAVASVAVSVLSSPKGKIHPASFQSCLFAGGVAVGVCVSVIRYPWEAMTVGLAAAVVSTTGFRYLKRHMLFGFECHDTRSILSTHGLPGVLGWLTHLLLQMKQCDDHTMAVRFAVFHISVLLITITVSLIMGIITALLKWPTWRPPQDKKCFDDQAFWTFEHLAVRK
ncbi:rh blood group, D antigen isoform X2 [Stigmatopora argus]